MAGFAAGLTLMLEPSPESLMLLIRYNRNYSEHGLDSTAAGAAAVGRPNLHDAYSQGVCLQAHLDGRDPCSALQAREQLNATMLPGHLESFVHHLTF